GVAGRGTYSPTTGQYDTNAKADLLVVSIENIRETALTVFDKFMALERANEASLKAVNPVIHETAEVVRRDGQKILNALTQSKTQYQKTRSAEDATKLKESLAAVHSLMNSVSRYLAEVAT